MLLLSDGPGPEQLILGPARPWDRLAARIFATNLDRHLAEGRAPESTRILATRAQVLVAPPTRRRLARDWEQLLVAARRAPAPQSGRVPLCRERIMASEDQVQHIIECLRAPTPTSAQAVAMVSRLLSDGTGPLCNHRATGLRTALDEAMAQLDAAELREGAAPQI
jgi:hypothetical protein